MTRQDFILSCAALRRRIIAHSKSSGVIHEEIIKWDEYNDDAVVNLIDSGAIAFDGHYYIATPLDAVEEHDECADLSFENDR